MVDPIGCLWLNCTDPAAMKVTWRMPNGNTIRVDYFCEPHAERATFHPAVVPRMSTCRSCNAPIRWRRTEAGKPTPDNPDGTPHWATCPDAQRWRHAEEAP